MRPRLTDKALPEHAAVLLERLTRLRVCTAVQARTLSPAFSRKSLRATYLRLATLVKDGWLAVDAVTPGRGAATAHFYRPTHRTLRVLGLEANTQLLRRPAQHVLEYLLFCVDVYVHAMSSGWYLGSPVLLPAEKHAAVLARFHAFLKRRALERYQQAQVARAAPAQLLELKAAVEQLPAFLPQQLDFEFAYRVDAANNTTHVVVLLIDDVRRAVAAQVAALPVVARTDCSVCIRDCDSVYDVDSQSLAVVGTRLKQLRRATAERLGSEWLDTDTLFPTLWARRTRPTKDETTPVFSSPLTTPEKP